jgi:hypothetical protein
MVEFRLGGDDLVEQPALAMLLARLNVRLRHRERLAKHASPLGGGNDHPGARGALEHEFPFLLGEVRLSRHRLLLDFAKHDALLLGGSIAPRRVARATLGEADGGVDRPAKADGASAERQQATPRQQPWGVGRYGGSERRVESNAPRAARDIGLSWVEGKHLFMAARRPSPLGCLMGAPRARRP